MSVSVQIEKEWENFKLDAAFSSESRRIGILGASGCGKSLMLKSIAGIEQPDNGRIVVNGNVMYDSAKGIFLKPQQRRIGYLFQNYALFPTMTVEQNITAGLKGKKLEKQQIAAQMIRLFHLQGLEKRFPVQLSGGQQQRAALARIFAYSPGVLLLDEPFSALDIYLRDQMQRELIEKLKAYPGIVILVSHNRDEVYRMSDELMVMDNGRLVRQGQTKKLFEQPGNVVTARLTGCKNITKVIQQPDRVLYADQWKLKMPLRKKADDNIHAVAIRAHEFSIQKTPENEHLCFPVYNPVVTEDLFEYNVSFQASPEAAGRIDWKISKYLWKYGNGKMPERLYLKEQDLLLLE